LVFPAFAGMTIRYGRATVVLIVAVSALAAGCAPATTGAGAPEAPEPAVGLPPIPSVDGQLDITVVHPTPSTPRPDVDSTFIYGSVGTGEAELTIDGAAVPVEPNGAFVAYLPVPEDGAYELIARARGEVRTRISAYEPEQPAPVEDPDAPPPPDPPAVEEFDPARTGVLTGGADTLATGSDVAIGRPTPGGTYRWFLPRGARLAVSGRLGDMLRVQLAPDTEAWFSADDITLEASADPSPLPAPSVTFAPAEGWVDVRIAAGGAPFAVVPEGRHVDVRLFGVSAGEASGSGPDRDPAITGFRWSIADNGAAVLSVDLSATLWGYKAFYDDSGALVLRIRRPPAVDPSEPLRGRRIAIDPGHPPAGATGPTGLAEAEANLAIALPLAEQLRSRGAEVLLTRTDNSPVALGARPEMAVDWDAELLISVHNNAFGEGVNPFTNHGTSVYYFQPFSEDLAVSLNREIVAETLIPDRGARWSNLALARPTWMPSALTESLFMLMPRQEAALRSPDFLERLAAAHVRGIEEFLRSR
jgi:N-acetylmuramoyl-L-alanine amidase